MQKQVEAVKDNAPANKQQIENAGNAGAVSILSRIFGTSFSRTNNNLIGNK